MRGNTQVWFISQQFLIVRQHIIKNLKKNKFFDIKINIKYVTNKSKIKNKIFNPTNFKFYKNKKQKKFWNKKTKQIKTLSLEKKLFSVKTNKILEKFYFYGKL